MQAPLAVSSEDCRFAWYVALPDKFISIKGNVIRVSGVRPLVVRMNFTCSKCNEALVVGLVALSRGSKVSCGLLSSLCPGFVVCRFQDGKYEPPSHCPTKGCRFVSVLS
jgi:DNA replicative helicase MCM subunit Mcm2 (Cdc46/Mcm family)